jgi:membrane protease YdiL (CAAX protease family)
MFTTRQKSQDVLPSYIPEDRSRTLAMEPALKQHARPVLNLSVLLPWLYVGLLVGAAWLGSGLSPTAGFLLQTLFFVLLLGRTYFVSDAERGFHYALAVVTFTQLLPAMLPGLNLNESTRSFITYGSLIVLTVSATRFLGYKLFTRPRLVHFPLFLLLLALSGGFGYLGYLLLRPAPLVEVLEPANLIVPILNVTLAGLAEELLFRGLLLVAAVRFLGFRQGLILATLLSASFYLGMGSWLFVGLMALVGLLFSYFTLRTLSTLGVIFAHAVLNIVLFIVLPLLTTTP